MRVKGSNMERAYHVGIMEQGNRVAVKDAPMLCLGRSALKHRSGDMVASVQKTRLSWSIAITIAVLLSFWSPIVFAQLERMESKVADGIKATLVVTPSKGMVDLILSDAKIGKSITNAKVSALMKGPDGKVLEKELMGMKMGEEFSFIRKIAIKNLAILQTCDLSAILRYRTIFIPHRIGEHTARSKNCPLPRLAGNLQVSPKIKVYFWAL